MKKRAFSLLLSLVLVLVLAAPSAFAAGDFTVIDGVLTKYTGPGGDVVIPNGVVAIKSDVFRGNTNLTNVTIPFGVTSIEESTFQGCTNLTSVILPEGLASIGWSAFQDCANLTSVNIPSSVTSIGGSAFRKCTSLTGVVLPEGLTQIWDYAFWGAGLTSVTIPSSVTWISQGVFLGCASLTSVTIPSSVTSIGWWAFGYCESLTSVNIPSSVTHIEMQAFQGCTSLASVTIPSSVDNIEREVFSGCTSLASVTIPSSVGRIGDSAFRRCTSLTDVIFQKGRTTMPSIESHAFEDCPNLTRVTIPASVYDIGIANYANYTICGAEGSYVQWYAQKKGIAFEATLPPATTPDVVAYASTQNILVNGTPIEFQAYALLDENGNPTNYVKLRDVASVLNGTSAQFQVGYDGKVLITTGAAYTPIGSEMTTPFSGDRYYSRRGEEIVRLDGRDKYMLSLFLEDDDGNGYTYFKLRDLGTALGFKVDWTPQQGIIVETE